MKTKAVLSCMIACAITLSSCNHKVDEKTIADINQFGTDWSALGEKATNWSKQVTESAQHAKEFAAKQSEMMSKSETTWDAMMKTKMEEMTKTATENSANFDAMVNDWNGFKTTWDENTKLFADWQGKVIKGEVAAEDVVKGLGDWKNKMMEAQQKIDGWNTAYNTVKESCDKNMASADEMTKSVTTTTGTGKTKK